MLAALLAAGLSVTIIVRKESKSAFVGAAIVKRVDFDNEDDLVDALRGHEAVISTLGVKGGKDPQFALIDASIKAGVQRFIPSEVRRRDVPLPIGELLMLQPSSAATLSANQH